MGLTPHTRFGSYDVAEPLGAGGMGEVFLATDLTLGRKVAIKALPAALAADPDRLARFEQEARTLAALNHPNIAQVYGLERSGNVQAFVMELVEGLTLAERIAEGPLPPEEALSIAVQMAAALEAAHGQGIVHRDLKPANIKLKADGTVKVLDFGIAKTLTAPRTASGAPPPRATPAATETGMVLGTAAYMSPEQARGKAVDERTDIWAFGCVLYEMLTGRRAFDGGDIASTFAQIVEHDLGWSLLPESIAPAVRHTIALCLKKDMHKRLADIRDVRLALQGNFESDATATPLRPAPARWLWPAAIVIVAVMTASAWLLSNREGAASSTIRTAVTLPSRVKLDTTATTRSLALSADGHRVAYVGIAGGQTRIYLRGLDEFDAKVIEGTDGARYPFFSPDGRWIGFFAGEQLKRVSIAGGAPIVVCATPSVGRGGTWGPDGNIVFSNGEGALLRVRADGGQPAPLTSLDAAVDGRRHTWPQYLPDGSALVSTVDAGSLFALSFATQRWHELLPGSQAQYLDSGYLIFHAPQTREGQLNAVAFDVDNLAVRGSAVPVLDDAFRSASSGAAFFAVAPTGTLIFAPGGYARTLVRVNRQGRRSPIVEERRGFRFPRVSPDQQRVAVTVDPRPSQIWVYDLRRGTGTAIATKGSSITPAWAPDGQRVAFSNSEIQWAAADGRESPSSLIAKAQADVQNIGPPWWSSDGQTIVYGQQFPATDFDIWIVRKGESPRQLISSPARDAHPRLSPDEHWIAYESNESGRNEVYVRPFPNVDEQRLTISSAGGLAPAWSPDGREIFYMNGASMMAVTIATDSGRLVAGKPESLFDGPFDTTQDNNFDVFANGNEFLMVEADPDANPTKINVVQNWNLEVQRLAQR